MEAYTMPVRASSKNKDKEWGNYMDLSFDLSLQHISDEYNLKEKERVSR